MACNNVIMPRAAYKSPPMIIGEIVVGGITIQFREGVIFHIFKKHMKDFKLAMRGAKDWPTIERNVTADILRSMSNAAAIFLTDERSSRADSLLVYFQRPGDQLFHCLAIAHGHDNVYNVSTGYKLMPDPYLLSIGWQRCMMGRGEQQVATWTRWMNPHIAKVHGYELQM